MGRAFFLNSGQNLIGGDARDEKTLFSCFEIMKYKNMQWILVLLKRTIYELLCFETLKTCVKLNTNFTRPHAITYTNSTGVRTDNEPATFQS